MVKWILIAVGASIAISILAIVIMLAICANPSIDPIPKAYQQADQIWSSESEDKEVEVRVDQNLLKIAVTSAPTSGTRIQYPDEKTARVVFPQELYFGAEEIRFNKNAGIIYVKVTGHNPVCGPTGDRIFEYDARRRERIRDYWIRVSK